MAKKKFSLWHASPEVIQTEKNVKIRERLESRIHRVSSMLLTVLLAGFVYSNYKNILAAVLAILLISITIGVWIFIEFSFLSDYSNYTDELIRKKSEERKKTKSK